MISFPYLNYLSLFLSNFCKSFDELQVFHGNIPLFLSKACISFFHVCKRLFFQVFGNLSLFDLTKFGGMVFVYEFHLEDVGQISMIHKFN